MTDATEKNEEPKPLEHKVGLHKYARVGQTNDDWIIIGAPNPRGKRWLTVAHENGGQTLSFPEAEFLRNFWVPNPAKS